ncbi:shikimate dehydrogenase [Salinibacterium sp. G-O1]|uniref:shikimate dehydrogenase family protein n=1 Tax=Salinibacterium sp. G-O1 TaxID=3046208 RepID=UPI0024BB9AFC|nr:shikimate dehydrogenase [Salinibacterium sp. G-O1]MDJ0334052.1 shikimate dehydrogenase [Salinibacterium sp. G-O1]
MTPRTFTADTLEPAAVRTFYFIGVSTGSSSIRTVFPRWAEHLGLGEVELVGIDLPIHAPAEQYRAVVQFIAGDPLSLGALVTTHKMDLYAAASDLFDEIDPLASLMTEVSALSKRNGGLRASAKDPFSSGLALDSFIAPELWATPRELFIMGAGGSAIAMDWHLSRPERAARPTAVIVTNRSADRLDILRRVHETTASDVPLTTVAVATAAENDRILAGLSAGAVVVNATGLGKDAPGSPLSNAASFPRESYAWDLNYRGDLVFLDQARAHAAERVITVVDGWEYFIHGWTQVIAEVFDIEIPTSGAGFDELSRLAGGTRA